MCLIAAIAFRARENIRQPLEIPIAQERDCCGVAWKAGFAQPLASGELASCERGSFYGMAQTITAEPRQPLHLDANSYARI
jgi:hypothetical protein